MKAVDVKKELRRMGTARRAKVSSWFFKTGKGQYGEGDVFIGITVPEMRKVARKYRGLSLPEITKLLHSKEHEFRYVAVIMLVDLYQATDDKQKIYNFYLANTKWVNNWDLVDSSAEYIVGPYLEKRSKAPLIKLAKSALVWDRRIAMLSTFSYIKKGDPKPGLVIAKILLHDEHDLIHKAVGWMLRETGNRCGVQTEREFLDRHHRVMPRTMLRYAIEKFSPALRKRYMKR